MHLGRFSSRLRTRGSILPTTFLLCSIAAIGALAMLVTLRDFQKTNTHRQDVERAYFAAESGVEMVRNWGNHPEDYDPTGASNLFYINSKGDFPNLTTGTGVVCPNTTSTYHIPDGKLTSLKTLSSKYAYEVASVQSIDLVSAQSTDPTTSVFKVRSVGVTPSGVRREILAYLSVNPLPTFALPAALISMGTAGMGGNGNIHWGEAWSKSTFTVLNKSQVGQLVAGSSSYDQWAKYRSEAAMNFNSTWKSGTGKDIYQEATRRFPGASPASGDYANGFEQLIPPGVLAWPDLASMYQVFKDIAKVHNTYYTTDAAGNLYLGPTKTSAFKKDFSTEFGESNRLTAPYDLIFIDTVDGTPPKPDHSNLATISNSGSGIGMKGLFWMGANFDQTGAGNPASLLCEKPDGTTQNIAKVYLDGVLYAAGTIHFGGNPVIYGSVVAEQGYLSGGTPEIYYNYRLANGLNVGQSQSLFNVKVQRNRGVAN